MLARSVLSLASLAVPCVALSCASAPPAPLTPVQPAPTPSEAAGPYRSVHIDTLTPATLPRFEEGRRAWVDELRRANVTDGRGVFLQIGGVDGTRFYTLRPFATFASFDTRVDAINAALARVPKEAAERYDEASDESLVFPHTSEIWKLDDDLSFAPAPPDRALTEATAAVGTLVLDDVRPDPASEQRYSAARGEIKKALAEARYPLTLRTFRCVYGAGHLATLVLAPSREALAAAPALGDVVARVRGPARAAEVSGAIAASIVRTESHAFVVRHDLTWPDASPSSDAASAKP